MKLAVLAMCVILATGCRRGKPQTVAAAPPPAPAPKPVAPPPPAPPPREPLSLPQSNVSLPAPQPIPPEALASIPPLSEPGRPPSEAPAVKPGRKAGPPLPPPTAKSEAEHAQEPRIQALMSPAERRRLSRNIDARKREIEATLERLRRGPPTAEQRAAMERVESFVELSRQAVDRGDLRQADALSARALSLVKDLVDGP